MKRKTVNTQHSFILHFCPFARIITFYASNKVPASKQALRHKHLTLLRQIISPYSLSTSYNNAINSRWLRAIVTIKLTVYVTVPTMWFIFQLQLLQDQCVGPIKYVERLVQKLPPYNIKVREFPATILQPLLFLVIFYIFSRVFWQRSLHLCSSNNYCSLQYENKIAGLPSQQLKTTFCRPYCTEQSAWVNGFVMSIIKRKRYHTVLRAIEYKPCSIAFLSQSTHSQSQMKDHDELTSAVTSAKFQQPHRKAGYYITTW